LVKTDKEFDPMEYKKKRGIIKRYPDLKEELESEMRAHLSKKLEGIEFNHEFSQREDCIID